VDAYLAALPEPIATIARSARTAVRRQAPTLTEDIAWSMPAFRDGSGKRVIYIADFRDHVNLGFDRGAEWKSPPSCLEGTGKGLRHVKLRTLADLRRGEVLEMIRRAATMPPAGSRRRGTS
jgi:hypothetical protein